jgi:hypothetical protein
MLMRLAAVITKYKGPEMEKPVIRPYTPTSDVGRLHWPNNVRACLTICRPEGHR